ncbi:beta-lactamase family protein [Fictibacillus fluitans]|uniref:Beta-lactamase family protein n=1 Tax=Fictibacillus fluitans TaxID=3058422 RepID=A0ABT8HU69_9BACL|nr:beta-lactamase family protein [Fictibacillus sp. NE201]MDN4524030.1 beta-lactamase family protein [Fictibacillus sp. NE201]
MNNKRRLNNVKKYSSILTGVVAVSLLITGCGTKAAPHDSGAKVQAAKVAPLNKKDLTAFADQFFNRKDIKKMYPGLVVTVVQGEKVLLNKGYGVRDTEKKLPVNPDQTLFRIGSVTKSLTATALMKLVDEGKFNLNDDIRKYIPEMKFKNPYTEPVQVKNLLLHNTGFESRDPNIDDIHGDLKTYYPLKQYIKNNFPPVVRKPGTSYMYDNFASLLQGYIVEKVSGQRYEDYMKKTIFTPLQMKNTTSVFQESIVPQLAAGYSPDGKPVGLYAVKPSNLPNGGAFSTGSDMAKFMMMQLNGGNYKGISVISKRTADMMHVFKQQISPGFRDTTYGFEAPYFSPSKERVVSKAGDAPGFSSYMWLLPQKKVGVFIANNTNGGPREEFYRAFMNKYYPSKAVKEMYLKSSAKKLAKFEGVYRDLRGKTNVSEIKAAGNGVLNITYYESPPRTFRQVKPLVFKEPSSGKYLVFREKNGKIDYVKDVTRARYSEKLNIKSFKDVPVSDPYAKYIRTLQILGSAEGKRGHTFGGKETLSQAEFIAMMLKSITYKGSQNPGVFTDTAGHKYGSYVQFAVELGIITPDQSKRFYPDRQISRQEAATFAYRLLATKGVPKGEAKLVGDTDPWAVEAVKTIVANHLYGPDVQPEKDGSVNYHSKQSMKRQEAAALIAKIINPNL